MSKRLLFFLPFILISLIVALLIPQGHAATPLDASSMQANVTITNTVVFEPEGSGYRMDGASGRLSWFPRETQLQEVVSIATEPAAERDTGTITFTWDDPGQTEDIMMTGVVRTRSAIVPVRERIAFPLKSVPPEVAIYLEEGEITDQTREIQALAAQLAAGKDDAYEVVYTLADWTTTNVDYSLASVGQPAIQKSSEVLESRYGKCDELTSLFISMNRALGIPARFVAGYSYTTSGQFATNWGGHGWAEVWLPSQGWVPFDVTYGEYGYLDAGHIALKTAPDAKETSIDYVANGRDFRLKTAPLNITVTPTRLSEMRNTDITITLSAPQRRVGFGSAALIMADIENNRDHYVSTRLDISRIDGAEVVSAPHANVLLKPHGRASVPFLVRIDSGLAPGYRYTFPFTVSSRLGPSGSTQITVDENAPRFDESAFAEEMDRYTTPVADAPFTVTCDRGKASYVGDPITHTCTVDGAREVRVCDERKTCGNKAGTFTITAQNTDAGVFTRTYSATDSVNGGDPVRFYVTSRSVEQTALKLNFSAPAQATPQDEVEAMLRLSSTGALPKGLAITVEAPRGQAQQELDDLSVPAALSFTFPGTVLRPGENEIIAHVSYTDEVGTRREDEARLTITLTDVGFGDRVQFWFSDVAFWIDGLFS